MRRGVLVGVVAMCAVAAATARAANLHIVIDKSVAGVRLGDTKNAVKARWGSPTVDLGFGWCWGRGCSPNTPLAPFKRVLWNNRNRAREVDTAQRHVKDPAGIHPGSSFAAFAQAHPRYWCYVKGADAAHAYQRASAVRLSDAPQICYSHRQDRIPVGHANTLYSLSGNGDGRIAVIGVFRKSPNPFK